MEFFTTALPIIALVIFSYVTLGFIVSRIIKRNDIADVMWGPGILLTGITASFITSHESVIGTITLMFAGIWASRLAIRIYLKNRARTEDRRYQELSASWGKFFTLRSYLQVFLLQGVLMMIVGYSLVHAHLYGGNTITIFTLIGIGLWILGFLFEAIGDYQLDAFLHNPENKGRLMRYGLWAYSRHPNYFGEITMWWGLFLMVISLPFGLYAIVSPLLITFLITKVSGIPMLEKGLQNHPEFPEYKRTVSVLIPWFPKK